MLHMKNYTRGGNHLKGKSRNFKSAQRLLFIVSVMGILVRAMDWDPEYLGSFQFFHLND